MIRKAFRHSLWIPTRTEFLEALSKLPLDDHSALLRFVHQQDVLSGLAGRLLIRHLACSVLGLTTNQIHVERTEMGKPFLTEYQNQMDFNITHGGDFTCAVAVTRGRCGVDCMRVNIPSSEKSALQFIKRMKTVFATSELYLILSQQSELEQMRFFYRHWCLKEAYLKAVGCGIRIPLNGVRCTLSTSTSPSPWCESTDLVAPNRHWVFEEHELPDEHVAAVAWTDCSPLPAISGGFTELAYTDLVAGLENVTNAAEEHWATFIQKPSRLPSTWPK
ncbi:4'-phosphopantetheinyl transferase [Paragonimus heterotremus]|uniref:L-aminoadipate-semialdehyde dehydrogenase-phosphopantetheinyl transferase n=1 Tax=Paragonimus heterotremus TaxID=100268 RepID=A0A8J4WCV0_9TREM|nr:4'-phosphopantetheinyl transferase [Paragonimus heterotremus]